MQPVGPGSQGHIGQGKLLLEKYGHDTRALIEHYRSLEKKYEERLVREPAPNME